MNRTTIRLTDKTLAALQTRAAAEGRTPSDLARHLLNRALEIPETPKLDKKQNPELPLP